MSELKNISTKDFIKYKSDNTGPIFKKGDIVVEGGPCPNIAIVNRIRTSSDGSQEITLIYYIENYTENDEMSTSKVVNGEVTSVPTWYKSYRFVPYTLNTCSTNY